MIKAVIFDLDGTLVDTITPHFEIDKKLFESIGYDLTWEYFKDHCNGKHAEVYFKEIAEANHLDVDFLLRKAKELIPEKTKASLSAKVFNGVLEVLEQLKQKEIPMAVASGSKTDYVEHVLESHDLEKYFSVMIGGDQVTNAKPHPETFLRAAQKLGTTPQETIVVEDSTGGMKAGIAGNFKTLGVQTTATKDTFPEGVIALESYSEILNHLD